MKKCLFVFITVLFILLAAGCSSDSSDDKQGNSNISADSSNEGYSNGSLDSDSLATKPTEISTPIIEETPNSGEKNTKLEDAKSEDSTEKDSTEEEYQKALAKQESEKAAEPEETPVFEETPVSGETQTSGPTMQLSEAKKNELIGLIKEYYGADEVEVLYIPPKDSSSTGGLIITYYLDVPPSKSTLENDLTGLVITSKQVAKESGITNDPSVNVVAMLTDRTTSLGVGNYYSFTGKTDIQVEKY